MVIDMDDAPSQSPDSSLKGRQLQQAEGGGPHQEAAGAYHQGAWGPDQDQLSADILVHMFT